MRLDEFLWLASIWICVIFFAFAAGVWYDENVLHKEEEEPEPMPVVEEIQPTVIEPVEPMMAAMPIPATEAAPAGQEPVVEETYLRDDIPLSYELQAMLYGACQEMGVEYELALAVVEKETNFRNVQGDGGKAYGYFQIWPKWHGDRMAELGVTDLMDAESNFRVGCHFLSECIEKYGLEKGLGYYNSGKARETSYSRDVMERMQNYGQ